MCVLKPGLLATFCSVSCDAEDSIRIQVLALAELWQASLRSKYCFSLRPADLSGLTCAAG